MRARALLRRGPLLWGGATLVAFVMLVLAGDRWLRHGLRAEWRTNHEGAPRQVARTLEHRVRFPNAHRVLARYVQNWDFEAWGVPSELPGLDARLTGDLWVPPGPARYLAAESPNETRIRVDGLLLEGTGPLAPGRHPIEIYWYGRTIRQGARHWGDTLPVSLELRWGTSPNAMVPVPRAAVTPAPGRADPLRRTLWVLGPLLALAFGLLSYQVAAANTARRRRKWQTVWVTLALSLLCLGLRLWDYDVMPEFRENRDELFAIWNGWSLLNEGTPRGWSIWAPLYGGLVQVEPILYFTREPLNVITPYFEHPPLFHLIAGAAAQLGGATHWLHAKLADVRLVPIGLALLTLWLIVAVGRRLYPRSSAPYLAGLLYSALPLVALAGRVIKEETLVAPLGLASVLFFLRWRDSGRRGSDLVLASFLAGCCPLAKVPGLAFVAALLLLVASEREMRAWVISALVALGTASSIFLYGAVLDWEAFWYATSEQAALRQPVWNMVAPFMDDALINHNRIGRGWLLFLWAGFIGGTLPHGKKTIAAVTVPPMAWLFATALPAGSWHYGWYAVPLYPFLCLGAGRFIADLWRRPELLRGSILVGLPLFYTFQFLHEPTWSSLSENWPSVRKWLLIWTFALLAPYGLAQIFRERWSLWLARFATAAALTTLVATSGWVITRYDVIYETHRNFDNPRDYWSVRAREWRRRR